MLPRVFLNKVFVKKKFFHNPLIVFNLFFHKSVYFGRAGSALQHGLLSSCSKGSPHGGFSSQSAALGARAPGSVPHACRVFLDQGSNLCRLHWQRVSLPLRHPGSPFHKV